MIGELVASGHRLIVDDHCFRAVEEVLSTAITVMGVHDSKSTYKPNRYGFYHMSGNVVEWTQSIFRPYSRADPYVEEERNGDAMQGQRVARGGSWYSASVALLYIPYRDAFQPAVSNHDLGFRIVARPLP